MVWDELLARVPPDTEERVERAEAFDMIRGLKAWPLLTGARGFPCRDLAFLADTLVRLSEVAAAEPALMEADLNPLTLWEDGHGGVIVDGLLVMSGGDQTG